MNKPSFWESDSFLSPSDFIIIGSGIVGLSAAIRLKELQPSASITIIERGALPSGASTKNAGFACFGSISELVDDLTLQTEAEVFRLVELRWRGLQRLRARVGDRGLEYLEYGGFELFKSGENFEICADKVLEFNKLLQKITQTAKTYSVVNKLSRFGFNGVKHLIVNHCEGQIHTGKMMAALLQIAAEKNIQILNGHGVQKMEDQGDRVLVELDNGWQLQSSKIIVAANGFSRQFFPSLNLQPARNQVLVTKPIANLPFKGCFHYDKGYVYFRNIGDRVLLGGGRNVSPLIETTTEFGFTEVIQEYLLDLLRNNFLPNHEVEIEQWWSGIMGVGPVKMPIIKGVSANIVVAVRLGGMGVAIGSLVGERGAELVLGKGEVRGAGDF